jgi:hypothetical protein
LPPTREIRQDELISPHPIPLKSLEKNTLVANTLEFYIIITKTHKEKLDPIVIKKPILMAPFNPQNLIAGSMLLDEINAPTV